MNLRTAKKVAKDPDAYTEHQRSRAAHRLYRRASTFKDGEAGFFALLLKPQGSFREDEQLDLRYEVFSMQIERGEQPVFAPGPVSVPGSNGKPVYRRDGQVHNFDALPYPNTFVEYGRITNIDKGWWEMGELRHERKYSMKKYLVRTGGKFQGVKPRRLKLSDIGVV